MFWEWRCRSLETCACLQGCVCVYPRLTSLSRFCSNERRLVHVARSSRLPLSSSLSLSLSVRRRLLCLSAGVSVKPGQTVKLSPEDGGEVLHLSQVPVQTALVFSPVVSFFFFSHAILDSSLRGLERVIIWHCGVYVHQQALLAAICMCLGVFLANFVSCIPRNTQGLVPLFFWFFFFGVIVFPLLSKVPVGRWISVFFFFTCRKYPCAPVPSCLQVCMTNPKDSNKTYVQVTQDGKTFSVCMLQKDKQEFTTLDLFFSTRQGVSIKTEGGKNEVGQRKSRRARGRNRKSRREEEVFPWLEEVKQQKARAVFVVCLRAEETCLRVQVSVGSLWISFRWRSLCRYTSDDEGCLFGFLSLRS